MNVGIILKHANTHSRLLNLVRLLSLWIYSSNILLFNVLSNTYAMFSDAHHCSSLQVTLVLLHFDAYLFQVTTSLFDISVS